MYNHKDIEKKMQEMWEREDLHATPKNPKENKRYVLDMFPYPSGAGLHVGHVEGYAATDIHSRFLRMNGYDVLHPMGWDAFGLPAENYAVKTGIHPEETTFAAIDTFRRQMKDLGLSYDWSKEMSTASPDYYKWTQWLFLQFYKQGLAYKKEAPVNWCSSCQTVLANEQVVNGACERCETVVEKKDMSQWFFGITDYAEELLTSLDSLAWPESTKAAQRNWIGKSEGAEIVFELSQQRKKRFVFIHGFASGPDKHFHPWLRGELEGRGHEVVALQLPNTENPNVLEQVEFLRKQVALDENTVVVAHSMGTLVALKLIEESDVPINAFVAVGGFATPDIDSDKPYLSEFNWDFNFNNIKKNISSITVLHDVGDDVIPDKQAVLLGEVFGVEPLRVSATSAHFRGKVERAILDVCIEGLAVFTTRPDTLYGATYLVAAPEHTIIKKYLNVLKNRKEVEQYITEAKNKTDIERSSEGGEKTGVLLDGLTAIHPITGEQLPLFIADYVLPHYGTGAIMAVPAHDTRDYEFAQRFNLPLKEVIESGGVLPAVEKGTLINSGEFSGKESEIVLHDITLKAGGRLKTTYRLRDWLISRQRYWGGPIPIVYDPEGNPHPVPEEHLPWILPKDVDYKPKGTSPLGSSKELKERVENIFGKGWTPEIDTIDTFVDSSWYFLRFPIPTEAEAFANHEAMEAWLPVDMYVGGAEHTVLHLLYSRFFVKALRDMNLLSFDEPFLSLKHPGMILGPDGEKMSKSKGNVINPDEMIERFGADTLRVYEMFMGPFDQPKAWSTDNMVGVRRFIEKVWRLREKVSEDVEAENKALLASTIKKVSRDIENFNLNTVVSALMILANSFEKRVRISREEYETLLLLLAPLAPHMTDYIWRDFGHEKSIHSEVWPSYSEEDLEEKEVSIVVQVNGKVRDTVIVESGASQDEVVEIAKTQKILTWIGDSEIRKTIVVPGRLVNFVV